jgi:hypothetical protein
LGDCYLISSLGTIADSNPTAIQDMIVDNGVDSVTGLHTYTVRFYANGKADYVTVDNQLPTSGSVLIFDGYGNGTTSPQGGLWIELIEKAYAQWNQTGKEGRNGTNTYAGIEGGWMSDVDAQVLGHSASSYNLVTTSDMNALIAGVTGHQAVTIGTDASSNSNDTLSYGLYGSHAYAVIGYSGGLFTLYNPWGMDQPQTMTWAQLQTVCDGFVVASTANPTAFATLTQAVRGTIEPRPMSAIAAEANPAAAESSSTAAQAASQAAAIDAVLAGQQTWTRQTFAAGQASVDPFGLGSLDMVRSLGSRDAASAAAADQAFTGLSLAAFGARL